MKKIIKKDGNFSLQEYAATLAEIKKQIKQAQVKAILSVNKELLALYWFIGKTIIEREQKNGWGAQVVERLAADLRAEFPGIKGFSRSNFFYMRSFYSTYSKVQQAAGQLEDLPIFMIPWFHNVILLTKLKDNKERFWYAQKSLEHGWSRNTLEIWIKSDLYRRESKAITNFSQTLPMSDSDMAQQSFKDPYIFDFLTLHKEHRQYHLEVSNKDFYIDLLFYHITLHSPELLSPGECSFYYHLLNLSAR